MITLLLLLLLLLLNLSSSFKTHYHQITHVGFSLRMGKKKTSPFPIGKCNLPKANCPSGLIIIIHQPRFPWNKGNSLLTTFWGDLVWGRYNLTRSIVMLVSSPYALRLLTEVTCRVQVAWMLRREDHHISGTTRLEELANSHGFWGFCRWLNHVETPHLKKYAQVKLDHFFQVFSDENLQRYVNEPPLSWFFLGGRWGTSKM